MKVGVAALCAGLVGGFGVLLFLVAFGTDYWLLAIENCGALESKGGTSHSTEVSLQESEGAALTFHHEGFFWRCWFNGDGYKETVWNFWFMNQAHPKHCIRGYLFPMPIETGPIPHPSYDATAGLSPANDTEASRASADDGNKRFWLMQGAEALVPWTNRLQSTGDSGLHSSCWLLLPVSPEGSCWCAPCPLSALAFIKSPPDSLSRLDSCFLH
ncbi:transmembrane protein 182-like isoform X2 [Ambystoma mexicanum]|uniref:transmembrane protein 182-like isoform X2 n=1 Tax=Ambystoma mexicanum TaxID=8296 RepID=UPI0037E91B25